MTGKIIFAVVAVLCLAQSSMARPKEADASTHNIDDLLNTLKQNFDDASKKVQEALGIQNTDEFVTQVKKTANDLAGQVNGFVTKLSDEAKKREPEVRQVLKSYEEKLNEIVTKLQKENPEATASAKKIQENLKQAVDKISEETKKIQENLQADTSGIREDIQKFAKATIDNAIEGAKTLQKKLDEAVKDDKKP